MFVMNDCRRDARVLKEAATVAARGDEVTVVALAGRDTDPVERRAGFTILRGRAGGRRPSFPGLTFWIERLGRAAMSVFSALSSFCERLLQTLKDRGGPRVLRFAGWLILRGVFLTRRLFRRTFQRAFRRAFQRVWNALGWFRIFRFYPSMYRLASPIPADVYHAHDLNTLPIAWLLARRRHARLIYDAHELYPEVTGLASRERRLLSWLEHRLIQKADAVITVNQSIAQELCDRYDIPPPIILRNCPPSPDPSPAHSFSLRKAAKVTDDQPIVLYQGGFAPHRGLEELIHAMQHIPHAILVMMGWGNIEEALKSLAETLRISPRVRFLPPVPQEDLLAWTAGANVGVIPYRPVSLNNRYTSPNKLFEYIQAEVPIAGSDLPELRRIIVVDGIGRVFNPEDPLSIARTVCELLEDPETYRQCKENIRKVRPLYCWEKESEKLIQMYDNLAKGDER